MPQAFKRHKLPTLQPRLAAVDTRTLYSGRSLKEKQQANGRTLALNGATWRKLRAQVLNEQPLCPECRDQGCLEPATEVDHHDNDPSNNARENLVGLCKPHHSAKTQADRFGKRINGCDADGKPLDPAHPWSEKSPATVPSEPDGSSHAHRRSA
ncbi:MAG: HNH endonuclease signature motif containing protein [Burkholderiaceae bacterium]